MSSARVPKKGAAAFAPTFDLAFFNVFLELTDLLLLLFPPALLLLMLFALFKASSVILMRA